jgi:phospholipase A1
VKGRFRVSHRSRTRLERPIVLLGLMAALAGLLPAAPQADGSAQGSASVGSADKAKPEAKPSYFTELWQLDRKNRASKPGITFHRSNYGLVFSYNDSPNPAPLQEVDPTKTLVKPEATFQLSFKARLWRDMFGKNLVLWAAYTQRSFWQLYNFDDSSPFRDTNYEPELLLTLGTRLNLFGLNLCFVQAGFNHQSNGQSEPLSRSWNRLVANAGLERGPFSLLLKAWYRFDDIDDDNPGITNYLGHGEVWGYYFLKRHRLGVMLRNNLDFGENRGAVQLEWSFPMFETIAGYVQYFYGYGESMLDHNHRAHRIGIGFILADWY